MIPTFVLHCRELPERTAACRAHLEERGVPATFFRSFHGNSWGLDTRLLWEDGGRLPPGHIGLNLGAWALWQHLSLLPESAGDEFLILEDDVELPPNFPAVLDDLRVQLNYDLPDWDLVFLGLAENEVRVWQKVTERIGGLRSNLCRLDNPFGTHAYIVRRKALPVLLDNMAVARNNLDQQLWERVLKPGLLTWAACLPSIIRQRTFDYSGVGKPQWAPSCVQGAGEIQLDADAPAELPPVMQSCSVPGVQLAEQDVKRLVGAPEKEVPFAQSPEVIAATMTLINPLPCIFRGECMNGIVGFTPSGRTAPLWQCARLDKPCHTLIGEEVTAPGIVRCETCELRTSMSGREDRGKLPIPDGHFNPSMIRYDGKLILATRDSWGHSKVALWELANTQQDWTGEWSANPIGSFASGHKDAPRLEDPRLFIFRDRLCAQFNLPDGYPPKRVQVGYCAFAKDLSGIESTEVYKSPNSNLYEKNWSPLVHDDELHWIYASKPKHVVIGPRETYSTDNNLPWTGGVIRGGATPVLMERGNLLYDYFDRKMEESLGFPASPPYREKFYYHFFHGCLKRLEGNVYTMGCAVIEAKPPFPVLRQTSVPLLWPDLPGPGETVVKRFVTWPGGAVPHAGRWWICLGIDDTFCRIVSIPFADVESALTSVPQKDSVKSIRETPIALGTSAGGK